MWLLNSAGRAGQCSSGQCVSKSTGAAASAVFAMLLRVCYIFKMVLSSSTRTCTSKDASESNIYLHSYLQGVAKLQQLLHLRQQPPSSGSERHAANRSSVKSPCKQQSRGTSACTGSAAGSTARAGTSPQEAQVGPWQQLEPCLLHACVLFSFAAGQPGGRPSRRQCALGMCMVDALLYGLSCKLLLPQHALMKR
jgi:hypothetical protein